MIETCVNPRYPNCKHAEAAHIPGGCEECVIAETCDMYMAPEQPPCWVQSWAKAHGTYPCGPTHRGAWGYCRTAEPLPHPHDHEGPLAVPAHESDAWLAGMILALGRSKDFCELVISNDPDEQGDHWTVEPAWHPDSCNGTHTGSGGNAPTLHAALCRAVLPEGEHTCS